MHLAEHSCSSLKLNSLGLLFANMFFLFWSSIPTHSLKCVSCCMTSLSLSYLAVNQNANLVFQRAEGSGWPGSGQQTPQRCSGKQRGHVTVDMEIFSVEIAHLASETILALAVETRNHGSYRQHQVEPRGFVCNV